MAGGAPVVWPSRLIPYSFELKLQLSAAKSAFDSLVANVERRRALGREFNRARREEFVPPLEVERRVFLESHLRPIANLTGPILGDIQGFLGAAGVVNSILWPSGRRFRNQPQQAVEDRLARGTEIRHLLGVVDPSILNSRTGREEDVRGGFLHFDEMIDEFTRANPGGDFVSFDIGSAAEGTSVRRASAVRWLDEDTLDLWVNGRRANLRELWEELFRVLGRIQLTSTVTLQMSSSRRDPPTAPGVAFGTSRGP